MCNFYFKHLQLIRSIETEGEIATVSAVAVGIGEEEPTTSGEVPTDELEGTSSESKDVPGSQPKDDELASVKDKLRAMQKRNCMGFTQRKGKVVQTTQEGIVLIMIGLKYCKINWL